MKTRSNSIYLLFGKRSLDIVLALSTLILFLPIIAVTWILVRIFLGSPVLFRQVRPGLNGSPFTLIKFRSMTVAVDDAGELLPAARRLTSFGRFLRSTSLDELPQLWNVLRGQLSLVGPRPLLMEYLPLYTAEQARRHEVRPGITGWAQVNGRNALKWEEKFKLDVWYVENVSFWVDMRILWLTIMKVLRRSEISPSDQEIMPRFTGTTEQ